MSWERLLSGSRFPQLCSTAYAGVRQVLLAPKKFEHPLMLGRLASSRLIPCSAPAPTWSVTLSITTRMGREMILRAGHKFAQHPPETRDDLIRQIRKTRFVDPWAAVDPGRARGGTIWKHDLVVPRRPQEGVLKEVAEKETGKRVLRVRARSRTRMSQRRALTWLALASRANGSLLNGSSIRPDRHLVLRSFYTCTGVRTSCKTCAATASSTRRSR